MYYIIAVVFRFKQTLWLGLLYRKRYGWPCAGFEYYVKQKRILRGSPVFFQILFMESISTSLYTYEHTRGNRRISSENFLWRLNYDLFSFTHRYILILSLVSYF